MLATTATILVPPPPFPAIQMHPLPLLFCHPTQSYVAICSPTQCLLFSISHLLIFFLHVRICYKGTMINFSVSRPGTMSKPMRAFENKKQSPQNKHVYPVYPHMQPNFLSLWFSEKAIFLLVFTICIVRLGDWPEERRRGREERPFLFTSSSRRREELNKGRGFREAASCRTQNWQKRNGQNCFFFSRPGLKINACRGRETEKLIIVP